MLRKRIRSIEDVAALQLCCGCGACAYASPEQIEMVDALEWGRRPRVRADGAAAGPSRRALKVCPGVGLEHTYDRADPELIQTLEPAWGPVLEVWEGNAADPEIRFAGSSGGAATALALWALEDGGMHGVLHTAAREDVPYLNRTVMSRSREELVERTGSRYAPASPCDGLDCIEKAQGPCAFIGKPCDVAAAGLVCRERPELASKMGLKLAFFCAGTPSTRGTLEMIEAMGIDDPACVLSVRYRGNGWPGRAAVRFRTENNQVEERQLSYEASWGDILQKHRQWRCHLCADHTGEFADLAVGDPWYRSVEAGEPGRSLVLVRSRRGKAAFDAARRAGFITAEPLAPEKLVASQPHFESNRGKIWARIAVLRLLGLPAPRYRRMPLFRFWRTRLGWLDKARSIFGTVRRAFRKKLYRRVPVEAYEAQANKE